MLDNSATHKTPAIHQWLLKHPRFHLHFMPTSSSWLNLVERWFAELTNRKLRRSAHRSVTELENDIASGSTNGTRIPGRSSGQSPRTTSLKPSQTTANGLSLATGTNIRGRSAGPRTPTKSSANIERVKTKTNSFTHH